ncbi:BQ2448_1676 [Microbotryum intermedium]|uniref:BQ2448_1676 protein n=1 Tax=Microbotryum intermedium TaxID=269621 RepID=A0A238F8T4_9BASI|nr:BQ2448_1676 [Microbotryum intermedium]
MTKIHNSIAENVLGTIGAILWSLQLVPQIWKSYREGKTEGLSSALLLIWFESGVFLGAYALIQNLAVPLLVQPQLFSFFTAIAWGQTLFYDNNVSKLRSIVLVCALSVLGGGLEVLFYYLPRISHELKICMEIYQSQLTCPFLLRQIAHNDRPTTAGGVLSATFIVLGLLPQYILIFRMGYVTGISYLFLCVDIAGGVFSTLALAFSEGSFDALASASYIAVVVLEIGIFILAAILNPRHRRKMGFDGGTEIKFETSSTAHGLDEPTAGAVEPGTRISSPMSEDESVTYQGQTYPSIA